MKSMHIRDFLRGGYKDLKSEAVVITKHGRPVATWVPYGLGRWKAIEIRTENRPDVIIEDEDSSSG